LLFFFQAEDGIRDYKVTGVQTCAFRSKRIEIIPHIPLWWIDDYSADSHHQITGDDRAGDLFIKAQVPARMTRRVKRSQPPARIRSEERRVGKECRSRWAEKHEGKEKKK